MKDDDRPIIDIHTRKPIEPEEQEPTIIDKTVADFFFTSKTYARENGIVELYLVMMDDEGLPTLTYLPGSDTAKSAISLHEIARDLEETVLYGEDEDSDEDEEDECEDWE